jgi:hypothetical protein
MRKASTGAAQKGVQSTTAKRRQTRQSALASKGIIEEEIEVTDDDDEWQLARRRKKKLGLPVRIATTSTDKDPGISKGGARKTAPRHDPESNMPSTASRQVSPAGLEGTEIETGLSPQRDTTTDSTHGGKVRAPKAAARRAPDRTTQGAAPRQTPVFDPRATGMRRPPQRVTTAVPRQGNQTLAPKTNARRTADRDTQGTESRPTSVVVSADTVNEAANPSAVPIMEYTNEELTGGIPIPTTSVEPQETAPPHIHRTDLTNFIHSVRRGTRMNQKAKKWLLEVEILATGLSNHWREHNLKKIMGTIHPAAKFFPRTGDYSRAHVKAPPLSATSSARMRAEDCSWRIREINKALQNGNYLRAKNLLQNNGTADIAYLRNIEKIIAKFPEESRPRRETEIPAPLAESIIGSVEDLSNYLGRLKRGAAPSISGWSTDHVLDMARASEEGAAKIWKICDTIARGAIRDKELREELTALRGVALMKGTDDIRTIGIQNPWLKITEHLITQHFAERCREVCGPTQLGNRIAGGAEILVHMVQALTHLRNDKVVMKLDISNAYSDPATASVHSFCPRGRHPSVFFVKR